MEYFRRLLVHDHVPSAPVADVLVSLFVFNLNFIIFLTHLLLFKKEIIFYC